MAHACDCQQILKLFCCFLLTLLRLRLVKVDCLGQLSPLRRRSMLIDLTHERKYCDWFISRRKTAQNFNQEYWQKQLAIRPWDRDRGCLIVVMLIRVGQVIFDPTQYFEHKISKLELKSITCLIKWVKKNNLSPPLRKLFSFYKC